MKGTTCWITAGNMSLRTASVVHLTSDTVVIRMDESLQLPEQCDLYFTFNCTVGRKCRVQFQRGDMATLVFLARIGGAYAAHNDNLVKV